METVYYIVQVSGRCLCLKNKVQTKQVSQCPATRGYTLLYREPPTQLNVVDEQALPQVVAC